MYIKLLKLNVMIRINIFDASVVFIVQFPSILSNCLTENCRLCDGSFMAFLFENRSNTYNWHIVVLAKNAISVFAKDV